MKTSIVSTRKSAGMTARRILKPSFDPAAVEWFYRFLSLTLLSCVVEDIVNGVWFIHSGRFFPWRHIHLVPLYPAPFLILEWGLWLSAGLMILSGRKRRFGVRIAALIVFVSLLQRYSNHRSLILIVLAYLAIPAGSNLKFAYQSIRYQLLIVYLFSAVNKLTSGFLDGASLVSLGQGIHGAILPDRLIQGVLSAQVVRPLSWLVVGAEIAMPMLLMQWPRIGLGAVTLLHFGFSLMMPGIWPFTFIMIAMATLFLNGEVISGI
jgi:hypothetical protein